MASKKQEAWMTVVACYPGKPARIIRIENTLEAMQAFVGGYIQAIYPFEDEVGIVCNEEGKLNGLDLNRALYDENGKIYDVVAGVFFVCGLGEDDFTSLTPEQQEKYLALYQHPQMFMMVDGEIVALSMEEC